MRIKFFEMREGPMEHMVSENVALILTREEAGALGASLSLQLGGTCLEYPMTWCEVEMPDGTIKRIRFVAAWKEEGAPPVPLNAKPETKDEE